MKSIIISFLILFCVFTFTYGCFYKKVDSLSRFKINGKVIDAKNRSPIEGASILFIDIGFDDHRKKTGEPVKVCESSNNGGFICTYEYFWGRTEGILAEKPTKKFLIEVEKDNYHSKRILFDAKKMKRIQGEYQVDLGDVLLE